jgi:hypothetical protein
MPMPTTRHIFNKMTDALAESYSAPYAPESLRQWIDAKTKTRRNFVLSQWIREFRKYEGEDIDISRHPAFAGYAGSVRREQSEHYY